MKKFNKRYHTIVTVDNLLQAWQEFFPAKSNHDVTRFGNKLADNIVTLYEELKGKIYIHSQYQAFNIADPKPRNIHKALVRDRLVHHLLYNELYLYFDQKFIYDSYSCRKGKGAIHNQKILRKHIKDKDLLELLSNIVASFHTSEEPGIGLPLGNVTSQLLINVYVNEFDQYVKRELYCKYYIRYADDFVFFDENKDRLEALIPMIADFLNQHLEQ